MDWMFWFGVILCGVALFCIVGALVWTRRRHTGDSTISGLDKIAELKDRINQLEVDKAQVDVSRQQLEEENSSLQDSNSNLVLTVSQLTFANRDLNEKYQGTNSSYRALLTKYAAATRALEAAKGQVDALSRQHGRVEDAEDQLASLKSTIERLEAQKDDLLAKNGELTSNFDQLAAKNDELLAKNDELTTNLAQLKAVRAQLNEVKVRYAAAIEVDKGVGIVNFRFELSIKEKKLVDLIREIEGVYPELAVEFAKIEWNKVWLLQLQKVRDKIGVRGIYRLVKVDDSKVCYVGQAVDIKTRWYTHCKKMIGAEPSGGEWLYRCRPDELEWTVLEVVDKDVGLDEVERYWIEFFRANEVGLNRV